MVPAVRSHRAAPHHRRALRGGREEAHGRGHAKRASPKVEEILGVENLYDHVNVDLVHHLQSGAEGEGALQARRRVRRQARRGPDRRRVHRPHPSGPPLLRGPPPGDRGQGERPDQRGEPDPRHDHVAELLPHVRQVGGHDRHGQDRGRRVRAHLQARGRSDPDEPPHGPQATSRT